MVFKEPDYFPWLLTSLYYIHYAWNALKSWQKREPLTYYDLLPYYGFFLSFIYLIKHLLTYFHYFIWDNGFKKNFGIPVIVTSSFSVKVLWASCHLDFPPLSNLALHRFCLPVWEQTLWDQGQFRLFKC